MTFSNLLRTIILILIALVITGCATPPPPFPTDSNAQKHYDAGDRLLEAQRYEMAAAEFEKSLQFEHGAYITHSKLAVAYFGQKKFAEAARQFAASYELWGGASNGPGWALMQAVTLQRAGKKDDAERLLRIWTGPGLGIAVTPFGAYSTGDRPLSGFENVLARYLLGSVDEKSVLSQATPDYLPLTYSVIGISNAAKGNTANAKKFLQLAAGVVVNPSGWSFALVKAEMRNLEK